MINEILECPVDVFLDHYAPFKPSSEFVTNAFKDLKDDSQVKDFGNSDNADWALAGFTAPFKKKETEVVIFKRLEKVMRVLEKVKGADGRDRLFFYKDCLTKNAPCEIDVTNLKVDAYITCGPDVTSSSVISNTAVIAVFKKANKPKDIKDVSSCSGTIQPSHADVFSESPEADFSGCPNHEQ